MGTESGSSWGVGEGADLFGDGGGEFGEGGNFGWCSGCWGWLRGGLHCGLLLKHRLALLFGGCIIAVVLLLFGGGFGGFVAVFVVGISVIGVWGVGVIVMV